jgi:formylglycine-generating enzyme required for sulfatase activity
MRDEELDTEKSHLAVLLTPPSKRMQYALNLTRALMMRIETLVTAHQGRLVVLQTPTDDGGDGEAVYVLNGKYYRTSCGQSRAHWTYVNQGFDTETVPVTVGDWRVGVEDAHLNKKATEQVMSELANRLRDRTGERRSPAGSR